MMQERRPPDEPGTTPELSGVIGRPPPFDADAEGAVLASCLLNEEIVPEVVQRIRPGDFYSERHARMYEGILELYTDRRPINIVSLGTLLKDKGRIAQVGGMGYLTEVLASVPAVRARDVIDYCATVRSKARIRRFIATTQRLTAEAYLETGDTDAFLERSQKDLAGILERPQGAGLTRLEDSFDATIERLERRRQKIEKPIPLPWPSLNEHFGGGLWPGVHYLNSTTGIGKTQFALEIATRSGVPTAYVGLETAALQLGTRILSMRAGVPWSNMYNGRSSEAEIFQLRNAREQMRDSSAPLYTEFGQAQGWPASNLKKLGESLRRKHPETDGPGSRPLLIILDFLQIIGPEEDESKRVELRERIGRAAYLAHDISDRLDIVVFIISSISREKGRGLPKAAELMSFQPDDDGRPVRRRIFTPDELIATGKESGEIEYSGDSVSVIFPVESNSDTETNMIFATPKCRAGPAVWSPLVFNGFRWLEPADGGTSFAASREDSKNKKDAAKALKEEQKAAAQATKAALAEAKRQAKAAKKADEDRARADALRRDAIDIVQFVMTEKPTPGVREVRLRLYDNKDRWEAVEELLGLGLVRSDLRGKKTALSVDVSKLPSFVREALDAK
jgi:replicative DNA helicase